MSVTPNLGLTLPTIGMLNWGSEIITDLTLIDTAAAATSAIRFSENEVPNGLINGLNSVYALLHTPIAGSLKVYSDGVRISSPTDFSIAGQVLTITIAPTDALIVDYRY